MAEDVSSSPSQWPECARDMLCRGRRPRESSGVISKGGRRGGEARRPPNCGEGWSLERESGKTQSPAVDDMPDSKAMGPPNLPGSLATIRHDRELPLPAQQLIEDMY